MSNNQTTERLAGCFQALSNPHRLRLFLRLLNCCTPGSSCDVGGQDNPCIGELGSDLGIAPSTLSHHMKELSRAGLIRLERRGQRVECAVVPATVAELKQLFADPNEKENHHESEAGR